MRITDIVPGDPVCAGIVQAQIKASIRMSRVPRNLYQEPAIPASSRFIASPIIYGSLSLERWSPHLKTSLFNEFIKYEAYDPAHGDANDNDEKRLD